MISQLNPNLQKVSTEKLGMVPEQDTQPEAEVATVLRSDFDFCMQDKNQCVKLIGDVYSLVCDNKISDAKEMIEKRINDLTTNIPPFSEPSSEYITAALAESLAIDGFDSQRQSMIDPDFWHNCKLGDYFGDEFKYRTIKQTQPEPRQDMEMRLANEAALAWEKLYPKEPVDKHAALRAEYAKQVKNVTTGFYLWEFKNKYMTKFAGVSECSDWHEFHPMLEYCCTDISCHVSKDGEPAIRMLLADVEKLKFDFGNSVDWFITVGSTLNLDIITNHQYEFKAGKTYTYRTKATIKLDGKMVTREQAAAEWVSKKETHDVWVNQMLYVREDSPRFTDTEATYQLRPKQSAWTGSREDVLALLKEKGLL